MLLLWGLIEVYFSYNENKAALVRLQREKAATARVRIEDFLREIEGQIGWASHSAFLPQGQAIEQLRFDFLWLLRQVPSITELSYLDGSGKEQLRVSRLTRDEIGSQNDYSGEPKFRDTAGGKAYFGPVYFRKESEPYMTMAVRWRRPSTGVTAAELNLKLIWEVVSQLTVGGRGSAYVVNSEGILIAHPDISLVLQKTDLSSLPQVRAVLAGAATSPSQNSQVEIGQDLAGRSVLTAHAPIAPVGWWVFVEQPVREAFAPVYASLLRVAGFLALGLGLSILVSLALASRMVKPIRALQAGAAEIGAGNLDQRIEVQTGDELEMLAEQFNQMAGQLRESYAHLEGKVEARTRELADAMAQLEIASRHKSAFLASMSHELRTPLNAIIGFSEVLLDPALPVTEEERTQFLTDILTSGRHLLGLINEVLDLSKIEAGRMELRITPASVKSVLQSVQTTMRPLAGKKAIELSVISESPSVAIPMDASRITQALLNLVSNAIKFTPANGRVCIRTRIDAEWLHIEVQDTGPGIPPEDHERIFQEFQQSSLTRDAGRPEGTGLGLALAKRFAEMHGGRIWVRSQVGHGSTFGFTLPLSGPPGAASR
jgi:signal transduction histidine kinase